MENDKKKMLLVVSVLMILLVGIFVGSFLKDNNEINNQGNKESIEYNMFVLNGNSCGVDCREYTDIDMDKEYVLKYETENLNILVESFNSSNYESSKFVIVVNDREIYNVVDFTTRVKIFKFKDIYVVEYVQSQSQCSNTVNILINSDGTLIGIPASDFKDIYVDNDGITITPPIMRTEFLEDSNLIVVYKQICSACPDSSYQIGFKYTYLLENGILKFQDKDNLYCV